MTAVAHPLREALPLFLLAGLCLGALDTTAKYLVRDHPVLLVVWARYAGQMLVVTPFVWHRAGGGFWRTRNLRAQLMRSAFLLVSTGCFFYALRYLPLAEASSVVFTAPIFAALLAYPVLGERPTRPRIVASVAGFCGILLVVRPGSAALHPAAALLLLAATSNAMYALYTRKLREEGTYTMLFYSALVGAVGLTLALPFALEETHLGWRDGGFLLLAGLLAGLGHGLYITAFTRAPASLLTPFTYVQVLWATLFGYAVFQQLPDGWSAVGMAVIVASGLLLVLWEGRRARLI